MERAIGWNEGAIFAVDQRALPHEHRILSFGDLEGLIQAIRQLAIRGAPAIGVAAGLGVALSARRHIQGGAVDETAVRADAQRLIAARPTAINLKWAVDRVLGRLSEGPDAVLAEALSMLDEDERINRAAAHRAVELIRQLCPDRRLRILTHCNTGALATAGWGTALGAIRELAEADRVESVLVNETRPLLQGARLTVWELAEAGIAHRLCVDMAGAAAVASGLVDCVIVGADRVAANGDVANKIGTYALACAAEHRRVPFIVVAPESTIDPATPGGATIVIEQRPAEEVTRMAGVPTTVAGTQVFNPAFDVTPNELVTALVTESRRYPTRGAFGYRAGLPADHGSAAVAVADVTRSLYRRGWMEGTSGNVSVRLPGAQELAVITASGGGKGELIAADTVPVAVTSGDPIGPSRLRPSAETAIHVALYRTFS
ncbi:MAG: S-methyl-5-thioribose-1-phosphate isomerase, partial [Pseudonocardiaceae bacterium]